MGVKGEGGAVVDMRGVCLRRGEKRILADLDWKMGRGEHWAVIGANGSGKTTLLKIAGGTLFPSAGEVSVLGERFGRCDMLKLRQRVGWVGPALLARMPPAETARDIVASGLRATFGLVYEYALDDARRVDASLERVGLADRAGAEFGVLSQGEQQRVLFARSMVAEPEMYILDEACSGLDLPARELFLGVAADVMESGRAGVVMVTHHIEEIPSGITHALILRGGRALASGPVGETVTSGLLSEAFGMRVMVERVNGRFWARMQ